MKSEKKHKNYLQIIGILLFIYLLTKIDLLAAYENIKKFNLLWLLVYMLSYFAMVMLKSYRWNILLIDQGLEFEFKKTIRISIISNFWGAITPGRLGELIKLDYLRKDNTPMVKCLANVVIDRTFDLMMLLIFSFIGALYFGNLFYQQLKGILFWGVLILVLMSLFFINRTVVTRLLKLMLNKILSPDKYSLLAENWSGFVGEIRGVKFFSLVKMLLISIVIYLLFFLMTYIVALGFNLRLPFIYLSLCVSLASLISLLPISVSGLGTREAIFILLLGKLSVDNSSALIIPFFDSVILGNLMALLFMGLKDFFIKSKAVDFK